MQKLVDYQNPYIGRGVVFRLPAKYPYENFVDFMVLEYACEYFLCASTGYNAGHVFQAIPNEGLAKDVFAIDTKWFIENWNKWIYLDCKVEDVYIIPQGYESESLDGTPINYNRDIIVD